MDYTQIILAVLAIISAVITSVIIPYLRKHTAVLNEQMDAGQREKLDYWMNIFITAAESIFKETGGGATKKAWVIGQLRYLGLVFDERIVSDAIEGVFQQLTTGGLINTNIDIT